MSDPTGIPPALQPALPVWACVSPERLLHIRRVAELVADWAERLAIPLSERDRWLRAVWLHDALRDAPESELSRWASAMPGAVELRHGPASAGRARAEGETDRGVLDAVRYHSVGLAEWDMVGRVLYCADFLEPGRSIDPAERAALAGRFPAEPEQVLFEVARRRVGYVIHSGWTLPSPTVRFWNALAAADPSS